MRKVKLEKRLYFNSLLDQCRDPERYRTRVPSFMGLAKEDFPCKGFQGMDGSPITNQQIYYLKL
jgi:hypothetical protein